MITWDLIVGKYRLRQTDGGELWLINEDDEGMTLADQELEWMLDEHFKENF